jgi:NAD(P)-dependent dehydrogenase (short-subunit alcohol dehydrogenase family)
VSRVVFVTGGAKGIGLATARAFARNGDRVALTYLSSPPPKDEEPPLLAVRCDITDNDQVEEAFAQVEVELGPVEVLVCNAGITADMLVLRMTDHDFARVIEANLTGGFRMAKRALPKMMRARWGRLVFVSSVVGATGQAGQANYAASKSALVGLTRSLAREFASRNITANIVAPGPISTDMIDTITAARRAAIEAAVPLGRFGSADEVAGTIVFLASDVAAYTTGAVIPVDGGLGMGAW